jgi:hypothetical protein
MDLQQLSQQSKLLRIIERNFKVFFGAEFYTFSHSKK